jgi:hypothetical protein
MKLLPTLSALLGTCAATSLHLSISPSSSLLDLSDLPSSTHATLYGPSGKRATAPLRVDNSFVFNNLEEGEWLLDIHSRDHVFPSLRVDVVEPVSILPIKQAGDGEAAPVAPTPETVTVYLTHPSNKWSHLGAKIAASTAPLSSTDQVKLSVSALGKKVFYEQRQGFDLMSFFKNPMILMGVVSMGFVFGMPYLMENSKSQHRPSFHGPYINLQNSGRRDKGRVCRDPKARPLGYGWRCRRSWSEHGSADSKLRSCRLDGGQEISPCPRIKYEYSCV